MTQSHRSGYFGKIPSQGDFVSQQLPHAFIDKWDSWLQHGLTNSQAEMASGWQDAYLTSPLWQFGLSPGICDDNAWIGVMIPSVDRIGRYFSFTIATPVVSPDGLLATMERSSAWFDAANEIILTSLNPEVDLGEFDEKINALPVTDYSNHMEMRFIGDYKPDSASCNHWVFGVAPPNQLNQSLTHLSSALLADKLQRYSVWSTDGSERIQPCLTICAGLPPASGFSALLDGDWSRVGMHNHYVLSHQTGEPIGAIASDMPPIPGLDLST